MADQDITAYEAALDALTDPRAVLARAMQLATEADQLHKHIQRTAVADDDYAAVQVSALEVAATYVQVARVAIDLDATAAGHHDLGDETDATDGAVRDDGPHALACRFTARFEAPSVGRIGGREWVLVPGSGWLDVTPAEVVSPDNADGGVVRVLFMGRAVSRYNDMILCITDDGAGFTLPAHLVTLEADA